MEQQISSWKEKYAEVKSTLMQMGKVESAATAFNTNVDAVLKIKGRRLAELAKELGMSWEELTTIGESKLNSGKDVIKGAFLFCQRYCGRVADGGYRRLQLDGEQSRV